MEEDDVMERVVCYYRSRYLFFNAVCLKFIEYYYNGVGMV